MSKRSLFVEQARTWINTPYHHQGRVKGIGVDCIGLILGVCIETELGDFDRPEFREYGRTPPRGRGMLDYFDKVGNKAEGFGQVGDILIFWINEVSKRPQHIAIKSDYGLIHTYSSIGKVVEHNFSDEWKQKFICAYGIPGID